MSRRRRKPVFSREHDPSRYAHLIFALGGFVAAWLLMNIFEDGWAITWSYWPQVGRPQPLVATLAAAVIAFAAAAYAWRREDWFRFTTEVVVEVSQVTWPTRAEIRAATIVVVVLTLVSSVILFTMDQVWSRVTKLLYGM